MPTTYDLISSNVLVGNSTLITFSSIPSTFTDLVVTGSVRSAQNTPINAMRLYFNGNNSSAIHSVTLMQGTGSAISATRVVDQTDIYVGGFVAANTSTNNTFSSFKIYIPNYRSSINKPLSINNGLPNLASVTSSWTVEQNAALYRSTSAITSISLTNNGQNFVAGSSFYLHGIKNS